MQCCTSSKWVHLKCSQLFLDSKLLVALTPGAAIPVASLLLLKIPYLPTLWLRPRSPPACVPPPFNLAPSSNAALPLHPRLQTSYPSFAHFVSSPSTPSPTPHSSGCFSTPPACSSPLTPSGFSNGMLGVFEPGALNFYTLFRLIPLTLFVSRNLILIHLPLSGSLGSLLCHLIAPIPGLVPFLLMPHTLAVALSSFWSGRVYPSLNFLPTLFLRLIPALMM